jgi:hypothetical protein
MTNRLMRLKSIVVFRALLLGVALLADVSATYAQDFSAKGRPILEAKTDRFGVDMPSGVYMAASPLALSAPGASNLSFQTTYNGRKIGFNLNFYIRDTTYTPSYYANALERHITVHIGSGDKLFNCSGVGMCTPAVVNDGSTLTKETSKRFVYREKDGTIYTFYDEIVQMIPGTCTGELATCNAAGYFSDTGISTIEYPNGEKLTFSPIPVVQTISGVCYGSDIITSNLGYSLSISDPAPCSYVAPAMSSGSNWIYYGYNGIGARRVTLLYGSTVLGTLTNTSVTSGYDTTITQKDDLGRTFQVLFHIDPVTMCPQTQDYTYLKPTVVTSPGGVRTDIVYYNMYIPSPGAQEGADSVPVKTISRAGRTWSYDKREGGKTVTTPLGAAQSVSTIDYSVYDYGNLQAGPCPIGRVGYRITQETDGLGRSTFYTYDGNFVTRATLAEGNAVVYGYDSRHNLIGVTNKAKPGSGIADVVTYQAGYDATCSNMKKCNQPNWSQDGNANRTDYTYDVTHGGVLKIMLPADQNGLRRTTFNTYTPFNTGSGIIYRITRSETCGLSTAQLTLNACPTTPTTSVTNTAYGDSGTAPNTYKSFLPLSVAKTDGAGSLSVTTSFSYDNAGRVVAVDGPRTDVNDIAYITYDAVGRKIFEIGVDPDGGGPLPRSMIKHTYDNDDHEIRMDFGSGSSVNGSDFVSARFTRNTYDPASGLLVKTEQVQP